MRSKSTIHNVIKEKENEILNLIEEVNARTAARQQAIRELLEEEKEQLRNKEGYPEILTTISKRT